MRDVRLVRPHEHLQVVLGTADVRFHVQNADRPGTTTMVDVELVDGKRFHIEIPCEDGGEVRVFCRGTMKPEVER